MESSNFKYMEKRASEDLDVIIEQPTSEEDDKAFKRAARGLVFFGQRMWKKSQEDETKNSFQGDKNVLSSDPIAVFGGDYRSGENNNRPLEPLTSDKNEQAPREDRLNDHQLNELPEPAMNEVESLPISTPLQFHKTEPIMQQSQQKETSAVISELNLKAKRTRGVAGGGRYGGLVGNAATRKR